MVTSTWTSANKACRDAGRSDRPVSEQDLSVFLSSTNATMASNISCGSVGYCSARRNRGAEICPSNRCKQSTSKERAHVDQALEIEPPPGLEETNLPERACWSSLTVAGRSQLMSVALRVQYSVQFAKMDYRSYPISFRALSKSPLFSSEQWYGWRKLTLSPNVEPQLGGVGIK